MASAEEHEPDRAVVAVGDLNGGHRLTVARFSAESGAVLVDAAARARLDAVGRLASVDRHGRDRTDRV
jgi:hypothetical protein